LAFRTGDDWPDAEKLKYDGIREAYWIDALVGASDDPGQTIIFVCGALHVSNLANLLRTRGFEVAIACPSFGGELYGSK
jgi:hypothetical protein